MSKLLVIGGSRGIGEAILKQNIGDRACVNISRSPVSIQHPGLTSYTADVLKDDLPEIEDITAMVYCPGSINLKPISSLTEDDFLQDFRINVLGAVRAIKKYARSLKKNPGSSIVLFSTVAVGQGMPFHSSIAAAKAGVEGLARSLAAELAPRVRVNCIAPSITDTPLAASILKSEKSRENISQNHPLKRILEPDEIAGMASYLISENARGITGQVFGIDGGMSRLKI